MRLIGKSQQRLQSRSLGLQDYIPPGKLWNRIALVEDHERMSKLLVRALREAGIEADVFERTAPVLHAARDTAYAVLVIDRGLSDGDGLDVVRQLRAAARTPCLMLTARDALHDRVDGLESGADDY